MHQPPEFFDRDYKILALSELDRVLQVQPNNLLVRFYRGELLRCSDQEQADRDFLLIVRSPLFESFLRDESNRHVLVASEHAVQSLVHEGRAREAVFTAEIGVQLARRFAYREFEANIVLARAYGAQARDEPVYWPRVAASLRAGARLDPRACAEEYRQPEFEGARKRLGESLADAVGYFGAP